MKIILICNAQPVKIPHFKSLLMRKQARWPHILLHFFNVRIMNVNHAKFQKRLLVEQFQGNYLNIKALLRIVLKRPCEAVPNSFWACEQAQARPFFGSLVTRLIAWFCLIGNCARAWYPCLNLSTDVIFKYRCLPKLILHCFVVLAILSRVKVVFLSNRDRGRFILTLVTSVTLILQKSLSGSQIPQQIHVVSSPAIF